MSSFHLGDPISNAGSWYGMEKNHIILESVFFDPSSCVLSWAWSNCHKTRQGRTSPDRQLFPQKIKRAFWLDTSFCSFGEDREERNRRKQALRKDSHPAELAPLLMFTVLLNTFFLVFLWLLCTHTPTSFAYLGLGSCCFLHEVMFESFQLSLWPQSSGCCRFDRKWSNWKSLLGYAESCVRKTSRLPPTDDWWSLADKIWNILRNTS